MAAVSLQGQTDPSRLVRTFAGSNRLVLDYLVEEVWSRQTRRLQDFLLQTAILDRLSAPLCNAVTRQKLRHGLRHQIPSLHLRASQWFEAEALAPEAIQHALAAPDFERAAALVEIAWPGGGAGYPSLKWLEWTRTLPETVVRCRPVLCVACAQALLNGGQLEAAEARLQDVEHWLTLAAEMSDRPGQVPTGMVVADQAQYQALPISLATMRAYLAQARGDTAATVKHVNRALQLFPEDDATSRATVTRLVGLAYWTGGDLDAAYGVFSNSLFRNDQDVITGTFVLAEMQTALGHLREADVVCQRGLRLAQAFDPPLPVGTEDIHIALSLIHREQGDLDAAARDLETARSLGEQVELPDWRHRWLIAQARLSESLGDLDRAFDLLTAAARAYVRTPVPDVRPIAALQARVQVKQGKLSEARGWAHAQGLTVEGDLSYQREFESLTLARTLIAQGQRDRDRAALQAARDLLARLVVVAEAASRAGSVIEILVLKALALDALNDRPAAHEALDRALALAEPDGYCRVFVDEGPRMARLLYETRAQTPRVRAYVQHLLDACLGGRAGPPSVALQAAGDPGIEPLSDREGEILQLIADGLSNQAIGERLFLALSTVKAHTRSIYGKLSVNSRTQAVARARALGVLTSD